MLSTTSDHGRRPRRQPISPRIGRYQSEHTPQAGRPTSPRVLTPPDPPPSPSPGQAGGERGGEEGPVVEVPGSVVVVGKLADVTLVLSMATTTRRWAAL